MCTCQKSFSKCKKKLFLEKENLRSILNTRKVIFSNTTMFYITNPKHHLIFVRIHNNFEFKFILYRYNFKCNFGNECIKSKSFENVQCVWCLFLGYFVTKCFIVLLAIILTIKTKQPILKFLMELAVL